MCNVAGALTSSQNAKPGNTPSRKESAKEEDPPSFSAVSKAANIMLSITEEMVPTPYKRIIRKVYKRKLQQSLLSQKIIAGNEQIECRLVCQGEHDRDNMKAKAFGLVLINTYNEDHILEC